MLRATIHDSYRFVASWHLSRYAHAYRLTHNHTYEQHMQEARKAHASGRLLRSLVLSDDVQSQTLPHGRIVPQRIRPQKNDTRQTSRLLPNKNLHAAHVLEKRVAAENEFAQKAHSRTANIWRLLVPTAKSVPRENRRRWSGAPRVDRSRSA